MMPTIRIDDDVFSSLKAMAEPFVDTPNTVIRRLLEERKLHQAGAPELPVAPRADDAALLEELSEELTASAKGGQTAQPIYETFLLHVLAKDFGGSASKDQASKRVIHLMQERGYIGHAELQRVSTGETRAQNTIAWGRNALKDRGLISHRSPRGTWQLTDEGMKRGKLIQLPKKG